ncbi:MULTISPECIES: hypothetical protein [unclassified Roseateles]|uniref:hypothetical protein n=1 Tax=unclassified Roseateles TaxID=2626991 RepID=UPI000713E300|nr:MULTISPECIES: hypothetical protein [unclassified Roseateles]KQW45823.1 hypothetical protein ASC81_13145 [Pelomonas sp. Root405]KRA72668.1 hypothetical protein ASD88_13145 [Pelomonas sp. Root662]
MDNKNAAAAPDKVAVVIIHGMGEQRPMETLRGFVETLWERDSSLFKGLAKPPDHENWDTWSKPDPLTGSSELRRITTARARNPHISDRPGIRADFFELHWADITADSTWGDFTLWFKRLLWRNPFGCEVPKRVMFVWCLLWLTSIAVLISGLSTALTKVPVLKDTDLAGFLNWGGWGWMTVALLVFGATVKAFLTAYFGDVARYVSASPRNIKVRQAARDRGLKLLRDLHASGAYGRVIIVGHSLGSILAHDLLALAWAEAAGNIQIADDDDILEAITECENAGIELLKLCREKPTPAATVSRHDHGCICAKPADAPRSPEDVRTLAQKLGTYREAQRNLFRLLSEVEVGPSGQERSAWLVSDLVTLGSPLTHANFLVAQNGCELHEMMQSREILRAPPVYEAKKGSHEPTFTFRSSKAPEFTQMHHAAAFAPVRWTNLHDITSPGMFLRGDMISGPVASDYGPGALDLNVRPLRQGFLGGLFPRLFTHTLYWSYPRDGKGQAPGYIEALRLAVNVLDDPTIEQQLIQMFEADLSKASADAAATGAEEGSSAQG